MYITVNGARLYFDVEGAGLVADGTGMREKPTLVLLHGGPGADHTLFKPAFSALADVAQIVYLDHRGNGLSGGDDPATWNLAQWGDDVAGLCNALGIVKPIVYGASFGGLVAQAYATRHPEHAGKLVLVSTTAKFEFAAVFDAFKRIGGAEARAVAERYWLNPTAESRAEHSKVCVPLYQAKRSQSPDWLQRVRLKNDVAFHFNGPRNEQGRFDFRNALAGVRCPVLVMAGDRDPIMPMAFSETIAQCLPPQLVQFERFPGCGHGIIPDDPERALRVLRAFIAQPSQ